MNKSFTSIMLATQLVVSVHAFADTDDADTHRTRSRQLGDMEYKRDQLKLQAEMADSFKKMSDAGFIVNEDGKPLGVKDIATLGEEVRSGGGRSEKTDLPFGPNGPMTTQPPFMGEQPPMGMTPPIPPVPSVSGAQAPGPASSGLPGSPAKADKPAEEDQASKRMSLVEVRADSIVVITSEGRQVVRNGEKINGYTLQRFGADKAYLKGPKGTRELAIDWTNSKRLTGE
ncbi:TPA: hypothetical protein ACP32N_003201 [Pseudomonas aeruginosa]